MNAAQALSGLQADFPPQLALLPFLVLLVLAFSSLIDALTGRVPTRLLVGAFLLALAALAYVQGWGQAGEKLLYAIGSFAVLKLGNELYWRLCGRDAIGMGDAQWTVLAVLTFGLKPVLWAWVFGAWIALLWLGGRWIAGFLCARLRGEGYVHFAPFLFFGLLAGLAFTS